MMCKLAGTLILLSGFILLTNGDGLLDYYTFSVTDIEGNELSLEKYRGAVSLVVNVASLCGYTDSSYKALKRLQDILGFGGKFNVLAFPCNQFGDQEPYDDETIFNFATSNYDVEFPMFSKIDVIGENADPAFKNLISQSSVHPDWNFYKYLVDHNGKVLKVWSTKSTVEEIFDSVKAAVESIPQLEVATEKPIETESAQKDEL